VQEIVLQDPAAQRQEEGQEASRMQQSLMPHLCLCYPCVQTTFLIRIRIQLLYSDVSVLHHYLVNPDRDSDPGF
jgi:hypothetical protein